ncbi:MAG: DnaJ domain-containing protein [Deltaproteobacteria bacterium]|nr:DnaJ domain-containing protein [Deltaproteobacteria bacterium]
MTEGQETWTAFEGPALARLVGRLAKQRASGILTVRQGEATSRAFFRGGVLAGAMVYGRFKPLGISLLEAGIIDIEALNASLTIMAANKVPQGQVMVELGAITEEQLEAGLHGQQLGNAAAFVRLGAGSWSFDGGSEPPPWTRDISLEPEEVVLTACRSSEGEALVKGLLHDLGSRRIGLRLESALIVERFRLPGGMARALRDLKGRQDLEELAVAGGLEMSDVFSLVAALHAFELVDPDGNPTGMGELLEEEAPSEAVTPTQDTVIEPMPVTSPEPEPAPEPMVRPRPTARPASSGRSRESVEEERKRRSRLLRKAIQNIPGAERITAAKEALEAETKAEAQKSKSAPAEVSPEEEARRARMASRRLSDEARTFAAEIRKWYEEVKGQDFYRRLRIKKGASSGEVKAGYLTLAKRFHPDRASALELDGESAGRLAVVFDAIREAYDTLKDPEERKRYDGQLAAGITNAGQDRTRLIAAAQMQFRKGLVAFKKKDFDTARPLLKQAYRADPRNGEWAVYYAWALFSVGPAEEVKEEVLRILKRAAAIDEASARAFYYLGLIARMDGNLDKAELYLTKALKRNEKMTEATTELRLVKRRMERETSTSTKRFMRKLLGEE